jgi:large subunit ribosomal protein L18
MDRQRRLERQRVRRKGHVRRVLRETSDRPRLSIYRSTNHIYAQVIDDATGKTVAAASSVQDAVLGDLKSGGNQSAAQAVGKAIAERAKAAGVSKVKFDRGSFKYHGRVAALANAAREGGLEF